MTAPAQPTLEAITAATPASVSHEIFKVELDDRCLLFPAGKVAQHLIINGDGRGQISLDLVFAFNRMRIPPRLATLSVTDMREFVRELVSAVYQAKTTVFLSDEWKITIYVIANGYHLEFLREDRKSELYLSTGVIWRVIKMLLMAVDSAMPVASN